MLRAIRSTCSRTPILSATLRQSQPFRTTTILSVRKEREVVMIGDGQVTLGNTQMKPNAQKIRTLNNGKVIAGFAGATADCFALMERLETKLEEYPGQLLRAGVELAKLWRTEKYLRHLNATIVVCDKDISLTITGNGDVVEPNDGVIGIGSGGVYASSAARALMDIDGLNAETIARKAIGIAADTDIYTNSNFVMESFQLDESGELIQKEEDDKTKEQA